MQEEDEGYFYGRGMANQMSERLSRPIEQLLPQTHGAACRRKTRAAWRWVDQPKARPMHYPETIDSVREELMDRLVLGRGRSTRVLDLFHPGATPWDPRLAESGEGDTGSRER